MAAKVGVDAYTRSDWRARPPRWAYHPITGPQPFAAIHHSTGSIPFNAQAALQTANSIQHFHQTSNQLRPGGSLDIAYTRLVFRARNGEQGVIDARGFGNANGATPGIGARSVAWCLLGDFTQATVHDELLELLAADIRYAKAAGFLAVDAFIGPHSFWSATACPGNIDIPRLRILSRPRTHQPPKELPMSTITIEEIAAACRAEVDKLLWERGSNPTIILEGDTAHYILSVDRSGPFLLHIRNPDLSSAMAVVGGRNRHVYNVAANTPIHSALNTLPKVRY